MAARADVVWVRLWLTKSYLHYQEPVPIEDWTGLNNWRNNVNFQLITRGRPTGLTNQDILLYLQTLDGANDFRSEIIELHYNPRIREYPSRRENSFPYGYYESPDANDINRYLSYGNENAHSIVFDALGIFSCYSYSMVYEGCYLGSPYFYDQNQFGRIYDAYVAAEAGDEIAGIKLGVIWPNHGPYYEIESYSRRGVVPRYLQDLADEGNIEAQYFLGRYLVAFYGYSERGRNYIYQAAEAGYPLAAYELYLSLITGSYPVYYTYMEQNPEIEGDTEEQFRLALQFLAVAEENSVVDFTQSARLFETVLAESWSDDELTAAEFVRLVKLAYEAGLMGGPSGILSFLELRAQWFDAQCFRCEEADGWERFKNPSKGHVYGYWDMVIDIWETYEEDLRQEIVSGN